MRLKLLYLSQCFPVPPDGGGTIKTFNTIKTLSKKFDIFSVFISERSATKKQKQIFSRMGVKVKVFKTDTMMESVKNNYWRLVWNYLQLRPHFVYQYRFLPGIRYIKEVIKKWKPDIIHVDHINSSQFLPGRRWLKKNLGYVPILILENHNLNHIIFKTRFNETKRLIRKIYLFLEGSLNYLYGLANYKRYDHIFSISAEETNHLKKYYKSVHTQPLVYPLSTVNKVVKKSRKYDILFVGNLTWPPNEVGIIWFLEEILPRIQKRIPDVRLHVVGKYNDKFDKYLHDKDVSFYGYVEKVNHLLSKAKVFVLPFKTGAGVRIKSLTALEAGVPIVSTKLGVGGLDIKNNSEYLRAENPEAFSENVIKLLTDKKLWSYISKNEKIYFKNNHSLIKNQKFLDMYLNLIKKNKFQESRI